MTYKVGAPETIIDPNADTHFLFKVSNYVCT